MAETITLTSAMIPAARTSIRLQRLTIDLDQLFIYVQWLFDDGSPGSAVYTSPPGPSAPPTQPSGATLISQLNVANLSTTSLMKRILQRLLLDGYVPAGTIVGIPL